MDALEADLIRAARMREAPWGAVAQALGLRTRQSAESRALRLERAQKSADGTRDAAAQRQERRCQRNADTWCLAREGRIREVCERLGDASAAWPQEGNPSVAASVHALAAALAAGAGPVRLADDLTGLRWAVAPYDAPFLEPVGKQAADAARACDAMLELLAELSGVRSGRLTADGSPASAVH
ncbi:hypothetical protein [Streptomyces sp. 150FB]|uniref:hypothetical protein n=1 Tax=Streptomyces sp. 150FB TaxID=1576605 RepID=UPI000696136B|nr:hypothetical protein [Streptomyces sp. 150FB]